MKIAKHIFLVTSLIISANTNAALIERLGGQAYYDDVSDLTWLADAAGAGTMTWDDAMTWASGLSVNGVTGWRLPEYVYPGTVNELSDLFYNTLGGSSGVPISISHNSNYDLFTNALSVRYWTSNIEYCLGNATPCGTLFNFGGGFTDSDPTYLTNYAWAVYTGDVGAVPVPAAVWLFVTGLVGLVSFARHNKA